MRASTFMALAVVSAPLLAPGEAAANARVAVPQPGEVAVAAVTTSRPPGGSQRPQRVLRVANGARLSRGVSVYASPAPACSASRGRFTALVVVTRRKPDSGGARTVTLGGRGVRPCGSYPLGGRMTARAVRRLRCDTLRRARGVALLLGGSATCVGAVERRLGRRSPYQVPLNLDLNTGVAPGGPSARNVGGIARFAGEVEQGKFRYDVSLANSTPKAYAGVPSIAQDLSVATMTFAAGSSEDDPNVVSGTQELPSFSCRVQLSPGLPGGLTCFAPGGTALMPTYTLQVDFDRQLVPGSPMLVGLTSPRYGDTATSYTIDVT
ncbi:MAG TPA: hypothetical protein VF587_05420 [Solirubrobacteraceae bacterium]|jgi:hypothetical protein